tara:strand:+ start:8546 stop:9397 length:852 start_codon:yes stop_codon:yes gene_type:complete
MIEKIGVIGKGFVGTAVVHGFTCEPSFNAQIRIYDKNPDLSTHSLKETINKSEFIFLSVPTPSNLDGSINIDILSNLLIEIDKHYNDGGIILIRSTVLPGTTKALSLKFPKLKLVFNPEFLTERNAKHDFINQSRIILGGPGGLTRIVAKLYEKRFGNEIPIIHSNYETAEMVKYMNNCFLATKVSFLNEMKQLADKSNVNWQIAIKGFVGDDRVGSSHNDVPGHDGKLGFGGSCFPKDVQALINFSKAMDVNLNVLEGAWKTNLNVRIEQDWKKLKGRAVVE